MTLRFLLLALLLLAPALAESKTLYVDAATGSDATTYAANDSTHKWATIGRAAWGSTSYTAQVAGQAAQAGDTVLITAGIYNEGGDTSGTRYSVALNPANSGTAGNLITFRGVGLVYVRLNNTVRGPMIGCATRNYVVWDNFQIDDYYGGSVGDTGPVVFRSATGCQIINSNIAGHSGTYLWGYTTFTNNYNAVRLDVCTSCEVRNNVIHRVWGTGTTVGSGGQNDAGVMTYTCASCLVEHNEIYDAGVGVSFKGIDVGGTGLESDQHDNIARFNYVHDCGEGMRNMLAQDSLIYQNIIAGSAEWAFMFGYDGSSVTTAATRLRFVNNTIYNQTIAAYGGIYPEGTFMRGPHIKNNIVHTAAQAYMNLANASPSVQTGAPQSMVIDRNLYYGIATRHAQYNADAAALNISFATWQGTYGLDTNGSNGVDPVFVNATPTTAAHFKLQSAGQSALTLGVDVLDLDGDGSVVDAIPVGAYISGNEVIGVVPVATSTGKISGAASLTGTVRMQ